MKLKVKSSAGEFFCNSLQQTTLGFYFTTPQAEVVPFIPTASDPSLLAWVKTRIENAYNCKVYEITKIKE
jgi:hypothetical protein